MKKQTLPKLDQAKAMAQYRYQCAGCTNDAYLSENKPVGIKVTCPRCGKEQVTVEANFIKL